MNIVKAIDGTRLDKGQRTVQIAVDMWCSGKFPNRSKIELHIGFFCLDECRCP